MLPSRPTLSTMVDNVGLLEDVVYPFLSGGERRVYNGVGPLGSRLGDSFIERGCNRLVEFKKETAVAIKGDVDRGVIHTRLDCFRVRSSCDREGHTHMSQVMETAGESRASK